MTITRSLYHRFQRYRTLQTDRITALPIAILMPHSACNCRCVMCDIWKGNGHAQQLTEKDISGLLSSLRRFGTRQVLLSGGEALLHPNFYRFCELLGKENIRISLLSTGITLARHAEALCGSVQDIIVSLDGPELVHNTIRNLPTAFAKLKEGIQAVKRIDPSFPITSRTVIHRLNFRHWQAIIETGKSLGLDQLSFLPADVSSHAFNREQAWDADRQNQVALEENELAELESIFEEILDKNRQYFQTGFIAEAPDKLRKILYHYAALHGHRPFPYKKCNAPWVSTVIEADGTVRPCFFHESLGNIREQSLDTILNSPEAIRFRKDLDIDKNDTCKKCVCYLHLSPNTGF